MFTIAKKIAEGQTLLRILMNIGFKDLTISGKVVDVGGGRHPDYFDYFKKDYVSSIEAVDGSISKIDFEKDRLPFADETVDTVVCANVLEHVYNHDRLAREMSRILKKGGTLVGFVPFLINYHPDPHDYFRYTSEALARIFAEAGFEGIAIMRVGRWPFAANYNNLVLSLPIVIRLILLPFCYTADSLFLKLRPKAVERYPLGYIFSAKK